MDLQTNHGTRDLEQHLCEEGVRGVIVEEDGSSCVITSTNMIPKANKFKLSTLKRGNNIYIKLG